MSRAAQEMQRLADELKRTNKTTGRRSRAMADQDNDKGLDIEPEAPPAAAAPAAEPPTADAAPAAAAEQATEGAEKMARTKKTTAAPRTRKAAAAKAPAAKPKAAAKAGATVAGAAAAKAPKKERDPLAGIRDKPKLPGVLLGAEISRKVVLKALKGVDLAKLPDDAERREVTRLVARIEARG
jgi:hypothetical protein